MGAEPQTLGAAVQAACVRFAERPALTWNATTLTYAMLDVATSALADVYRVLGVSRGDRVACQLPNRPELLIAAAAAWRCGAVHAGVDRDLTAPEVSSLVGRLEASALILDSAASAAPSVLEAVRRDHPRVGILTCDGEVEGDTYCISPELLSTSAVASPAAPLDPDDPAVILVTSGTTGTPKAVIRYHGQLLGHWTRTATLLGASLDDVHLAQLPLTHGFGFGLAVAGLLTGGRLVLLERFSPEHALELIATEGITVLNGTPAHFRLLFERFEPARHDTSSLRAGAGAAARFPPPLLRRMFDELGMDFVHSYGCSEGLGWKTVDREEMLRGAVGKPPADRLRIVGPDRRPLPPGRTGEVAVRKTHAVRYWGQPDPGATLDDEWHYTGDIGVVDDEGFLYVFGRTGHQVNRGGLKVDCGEVEARLVTHPELLDASIVGIPDSVLGEIVCACIVPAHPPGPDLAEIRGYLEGSLAVHKLPERLCVVEAIPHTRIGKVDRPGLQKLVVESARQASVVEAPVRADSS